MVALQKAAQCTKTVVLQMSVIERNAADVLTKFWTVESIGVNDIEEMKSLHRTLKFFEETIKQVDGH